MQVHADNAARVLLNGTEIGARPDDEIFPNFRDPAETYTVAGPFVAGTNTLDFIVHNFSGPMGLDYKAVVTFTSNTPPSLHLPADITVNATEPTGATVEYTVTASDLSDPSPDVTCTPTSGSSFAVGTTTVSCTATDDGGLSTSGTFSVTVLSADQQLDELLHAVQGVGPGNSLVAKVESARAALVRGNVWAACASLAAFVNEVEAQSGKALTTAQAPQLIDDATRIRAVLGCTS